MKHAIGVLLAIMVMIGFSTQAAAQFLPTVKEITAFGGQTFGDDDEVTAGVAAAMNISPRVGVEAEGSAIFYNDTTFTANVNLVLNLGSGTTPIVPYLTGGAGMFINGDEEIALNVGFGMKMFVEPNLALRLDGRGFFSTEGGEVEDMERVYGGFMVFF